MVKKSEPRIEASSVWPLFPTFVWESRLEPGLYTTLNAALLQRLDELRGPVPDLPPGGSWQSEQELHKLPELGELVSCIRRVTKSILEFLKIGYEGFEITGCWANINNPGAAHAMHSHPNNFLSGVYYVKTQAGADTISFHDPRAQASIIRPPVTRLTAENTDQVVVKVQDGTILLFPAWLQHSVAPNTSHERRVSISFNIMFSSYAETMSKPLW
jgi:uncharacterized protein (TIGR02466 family)